MDRDSSKVLDELLVAAARAGEAEVFAHLVRRWTPGLRKHAHRLVGSFDQAEDAVQDTWIGVARGLRKLEDPRRFPAWAYAIATHRCLDQLRRSSRARRSAVAVTESEQREAWRDERVDSRIDLAAAIAALPLPQRIVVSLHYGADLSVEEIATAHRIPAGTVKSRLHAARRTLKAFFSRSRR